MANEPSGGTGLLGVVIVAALIFGIAFYFVAGFNNPVPGKIGTTTTTQGAAQAAPTAQHRS